MQLFKRMMISLFPDEMVHNPMNPASIFVWFISAKQYFTVISRKIVENYKLNLFDISLDPFEVKIWFGESPTIKVKDVDFYYGYAAAANLNGYRSYAPGQIAHAITLVTSIYCETLTDTYDDNYVMQLLYTVYLTTFVFQSKIKQFPFQTQQENFNWMLEVFFSIYAFLLEQSGKKRTQQNVYAIKKHLLQEHIAVFCMLYQFYQYAAHSLDIPGITPYQLHTRLFYDEIKGGNMQPLVDDYMRFSNTTVFATDLSVTEKNIVHLIFPADILTRYVFEGQPMQHTIRHLIKHMYDTAKIDTMMQWFLWDKKQDPTEFFTYITDYTLVKQSFFSAVKKYVTHLFQKSDGNEIHDMNDMDERMSSIGGGESIDMSRVPARLRQESEVTERLMNFYITYIGGYRLGRWDVWYVRGVCQPLLTYIMDELQSRPQVHDAMYYYSGLLYSYSKNVFYYKYAFENIRAGKEKFQLPFRATFREVYSNPCIIKLFESYAISTVLQDILPKDVKLFVKNQHIIEAFGASVGKSISALVNKNYADMSVAVYGPLDRLLHMPLFVDAVLRHLPETIMWSIKESLYTLDYWLYQALLARLETVAHLLQEKYSDASICGIVATLRETFLWCLLYAYYVRMTAEKTKKPDHLYILLSFYVVDILMLSDDFIQIIQQACMDMLEEYGTILGLLIPLDDNEWYLKIAYDNWQSYSKNKTSEGIFWGLAGEDIIWYRWFLKTVTYYNKRYIMP